MKIEILNPGTEVFFVHGNQILKRPIHGVVIRVYLGYEPKFDFDIKMNERDHIVLTDTSLLFDSFSSLVSYYQNKLQDDLTSQKKQLRAKKLRNRDEDEEGS